MAFTNMSLTPNKGSRRRSSSDSDLIMTAASTPAPPSSSASENGTQDRIDSPVASATSLSPPVAAPAHVSQSAGATTTNTVGNGLAALGPAALALPVPSVPFTHFLLRQAQYIYGPDACVFVGNLPSQWPDGILTVAVESEMGRYGLCMVGIFRRVWYKPYAIVQYMTEGDAVHARISSVYMDRPWRVERSNRSRY